MPLSESQPRTTVPAHHCPDSLWGLAGRQRLLWVLRSFLLVWLVLFGTSAVTQAQTLPSDTQPKSITVVLDDNYPPFIFRDAAGQTQGILKDSWALWEKRTGITVKLQAMDWAKALEVMQAGQADVIDTIFLTEARKQIYDFSAPYARLDVPIFFHQSISGIVNADSLKGFTVGVKAGDACIDVLHAHGVNSTKPYPSYSALIAAAATADVRVFCVDQAPAVYLLNQRGIEKEFRHSVPLYTGEFHRAVRKGNAALLKVVEDGFARISAAERHTIERKWYGAEIERPGISTYARYGAYALLGLVLVALALAFWNRMLQRRVRAKTAELSSSLAALSREKQVTDQTLAQMNATLDAIPDLWFEVDLEGRFHKVHTARPNLLVAPPQDMLDHLIADVMPSNAAAVCLASLQEANESGRSYGLQFSITLPQRIMWFELSVRRKAGLPGEAPRFIAIARDISERKLAQEELRESEERYRTAFMTSPDAININRLADGLYIDANNGFLGLIGWTRDQVIGRTSQELNIWHDMGDRQRLVQALQRDGYYENLEANFVAKDGRVIAALMSAHVITVKGEKCILSVTRDITERKQHLQQLEHIAHFDMLTGLPNRVLLADRLHQVMAQAQRREERLAVAYLDLDGFKAINDKHGHAVGDQVLMMLAARMKQALREGDTLARIGGDEFVAVLLDVADIETGAPMLKRLLAAAAEPVPVDALVLKVSASLGVTFYPQAEEVDADQLLRQSDQAMYLAKQAGKNRYHVFDAELDRSARGHHESVERIRRALAEREFVLYYQPKVNMRSGAVIGAEALIRWQHPEQGLLAPAAFLPLIEDHPLAVDIGEWVIDTALRQLELWHDGGLDIPISVNVGARQLQQGNFVERLRAILLAHPEVRPGQLELEVLETSALEDISQIFRVIEECRLLGVSFALDDFGTGYSSLTYLKRLPVSLLKIDQSFVRDMLDNPDDLSILNGVVGLARAFHRQVIAEGVESIASGTLLLQLGCDLAQGYVIAHPMPASDLPAWAADWQPDPAWGRPV